MIDQRKSAPSCGAYDSPPPDVSSGLLLMLARLECEGGVTVVEIEATEPLESLEFRILVDGVVTCRYESKATGYLYHELIQFAVMCGRLGEPTPFDFLEVPNTYPDLLPYRDESDFHTSYFVAIRRCSLYAFKPKSRKGVVTQFFDVYSDDADGVRKSNRCGIGASEAEFTAFAIRTLEVLRWFDDEMDARPDDDEEEEVQGETGDSASS